jgi:hypothetical protein
LIIYLSFPHQRTHVECKTLTTTSRNIIYSHKFSLYYLQGEDDGQIERELPVTETITDLKTVVYEVKVLTGDRRGAGTDATVSIVLFGENGVSSGPPKVLQNAFNNFERGIPLSSFVSPSSHLRFSFHSVKQKRGKNK